MNEKENIMNNELSIEHELFKRFPKVFEYAMQKTTEELNQSVEGMYHNLNTLN